MAKAKKMKASKMPSKPKDMGFNMTPKYPKKHFGTKKKVAKLKKY